MWFPQRRVCHASMVRAEAEAQYDQLHEKRQFHDGTFTSWSDKRSPQHPFHYRDGVTLWVSDIDLTPHDHFLGGAKDCSECQDDDEEVDVGDSP